MIKMGKLWTGTSTSARNCAHSWRRPTHTYTYVEYMVYMESDENRRETWPGGF